MITCQLACSVFNVVLFLPRCFLQCPFPKAPLTGDASVRGASMCEMAACACKPESRV